LPVADKAPVDTAPVKVPAPEDKLPTVAEPFLFRIILLAAVTDPTVICNPLPLIGSVPLTVIVASRLLNPP